MKKRKDGYVLIYYRSECGCEEEISTQNEKDK